MTEKLPTHVSRDVTCDVRTGIHWPEWLIAVWKLNSCPVTCLRHEFQLQLALVLISSAFTLSGLDCNILARYVQTLFTLALLRLFLIVMVNMTCWVQSVHLLFQQKEKLELECESELEIWMQEMLQFPAPVSGSYKPENWVGIGIYGIWREKELSIHSLNPKPRTSTRSYSSLRNPIFNLQKCTLRTLTHSKSKPQLVYNSTSLFPVTIGGVETFNQWLLVTGVSRTRLIT
jgi:hypothetical protein